MSQIEWTTKHPNITGFYWVRKASLPCDTLMLLLIPAICADAIPDHCGLEWYGPVQIECPHDVREITASSYLFQLFMMDDLSFKNKLAGARL